MYKFYHSETGRNLHPIFRFEASLDCELTGALTQTDSAACSYCLSCANAQMALSRADDVLQEYVQRVRQDARVGEQVLVTDELFSIMRRRPSRNTLQALSLRRSLWATGLGRRGDCGAWRVLLLNERQWQQHFGLVPSRSGTPLLIVWARQSAVEKSAVVYKLDCGELLEAAS